MKFLDACIEVSTNSGRKIHLFPEYMISINISGGIVEVEYLDDGIKTKISAPIGQVEFYPVRFAGGADS